MSSQEGSEASSYDSGEYGAVARAGFARMYVLSHSSLCPLDQTVDYRSERVDDKDAKANDSGNSGLTGRRKRYEDLEGEYGEEDGEGPERFQLLYANGRHYFHGTIPLPDGFQDNEGREEEEEEEEGHDVGGEDASRRGRGGRQRRGVSAAESIGVEDLPLLLPHFQRQQDQLTCIDHVTHFRQELRDVVYQMEEVGEFMVEELSKDKIIQRIEEGSKEFHWMVSPQNPTFFELQTYRRTNESFTEAGVVIIVLKVVVRGVLLDVIYYKNSYFITLRDNADELALEDTFVPNLSCVGPCYLVRRYSDEDLKQLLLWCSFPPEPELVVEGKCPASLSKATTDQIHLPAQVTPNVLKVAPVRSNTPESILQANDTQLYCLLPTTNPTKSRRDVTRKRKKVDEDEKEDDGDNEHECDVVFQFNQFVYSGTSRLRIDAISDLGRLSRHVLPSLKTQAFESLRFFGSMANYTDPTELPMSIQWMSHVRNRFDDIAATLMDLVTESQVWVERFLAEVDSAARESAKSTENAAWLGSHLRAWLDNADGTEYFFELEVSVAPSRLWGARREEEREELKSSDITLMLWKGIVNQVVVVVVYRRGSFFVVLRELKDVADMPRDGLEFFGLLPELDSKGRGYLVRSFPKKIERRSQQWLSGAKLLLWQTTGSVCREDLAAEDAQSKWLQSQSKRDEEKETAAWFEDKDNEKPYHGRGDDALRMAARVDDDDEKNSERGRPAPSPAQRQRDKSGRRHHLAPLADGSRASGPVPVAPWDIQTGRPL